MHDAVLFEFPKLLGQHSLADARNLAAQYGEAMRAFVRQVKEDYLRDATLGLVLFYFGSR
jgi:hypothetical protein